MTVRTRFAPSPTGLLHLGNVRTALYAWLYARKMKGQFILRIEDTDPVRSTPENIQVILDTLEWLNLDYDEGPYYQTKRYDRYREMAQLLLNEDKAYRCYCSKERLEKLRQEQLNRKEKPRYDGHCSNLKEIRDEPFVIRLRSPKKGIVQFTDMIHGELTFQNSELDDLILLREDGSPTYNFGVVVDDLDMEITHVIRGDDHINNTPRQINLYYALEKKPPYFGHTPTLLCPDGKRLSKRHGAVSALQFREEGYLPHALLNYLLRLGWSHGDQEIFSREEMIELFDIEHINKAPAAINPEKLIWLNQHYLKTMPPETVAEELQLHMVQQNIDTSEGPKLSDVVVSQAERCKTLKEMAEKSRYFYEDFETYDTKAAAKHLIPENKELLIHIRQAFEALDHWQAKALHEIIIKTADQFNTKLGSVAQPIRFAVTGGTVSPPIDITLVLIGRTVVLKRLEKALQFINNR
jgi:glutamyl-tRNA synthetase